MSGVVAPTMTKPTPPLATSVWWWMSRSLTSPSACDELMSIGTLTIRLGSSMVPIWSGLNRWGTASSSLYLVGGGDCWQSGAWRAAPQRETGMRDSRTRPRTWRGQIATIAL